MAVNIPSYLPAPGTYYINLELHFVSPRHSITLPAKLNWRLQLVALPPGHALLNLLLCEACRLTAEAKAQTT